ncbi:MAG: DUF167 domain-containing protein [Bacteroidetes bacterium]|nr:DUF167 domain-containing protein [Bacteroidota bacterium]MBK8660076.1 DUF167 domain-containing protein [Bacteroidota bacterium]
MFLKLKVKPGAKTDAIIREPDGTLKVKIKAPPVDGKANAYLLKYLSRILQVPTAQLRIKTGSNSSHKLLEIDAEAGHIEAILQALPGSA